MAAICAFETFERSLKSTSSGRSGPRRWRVTVPRRVNAPLRRLTIDWLCLLINPQPPRAASLWRMAFSFRQIQYFVAAAENGALSCAARELSISQSTIAEAIRDVPESTVCHRWDCLGGSLDERFYHGALPVPITSGPVPLTALSIDLRSGDTARFRVASIQPGSAVDTCSSFVSPNRSLRGPFLAAALQAAQQQSFHHAVAGFQLVERNELVRLVALIH